MSISSLPDVQSSHDERNLRIDNVGIKGLRYPIDIQTSAGPLSVVANWTMTVELHAGTKGTHMSRFIEMLEEQKVALDHRGFMRLSLEMLERLGAVSGEIQMRFPYFLAKPAPVSGVVSKMDYDVCWIGRVSANGKYDFNLQVTVPVTSLCPCSKKISRYGAHNQRSHVTINARLIEPMATDELITIAERGASCELYGILKRPDEKYVTERAYDNPKFVEDLVRDVAQRLTTDSRIASFSVTVENFESIHNHSAFACITRPIANAGVVNSSVCHIERRDLLAASA